MTRYTVQFKSRYDDTWWNYMPSFLTRRGAKRVAVRYVTSTPGKHVRIQRGDETYAYLVNI